MTSSADEIPAELASKLHLIPQPTKVYPGSAVYKMTEGTSLIVAPGLEKVGRWLQAALVPATGLNLPMAVQAAEGIRLSIDPMLPPEGYRLEVALDGVSISGGDSAGVFYGAQTLRQLLPEAVYRRSTVSATDWSVPAVRLSDEPRFVWRGLMLDVARHFLPVVNVLRLIDLMAVHRLNRLHLHLTDDQGWRVQINRYPRLTEVGSWRTESQLGVPADAPGDGRPHGGFYSQDDIREIVQYAAERFISVVPEIDIPGHSQAAIAAYPELGVTGQQLPVFTRWGISRHPINTEDSTIEFFRNVLDELMELFPDDYIALGGDECPKDAWKADPRTQELMAGRGLRDEIELQGWVLNELGTHVRASGRRVFAWDDVLEGSMPPNTVIASWRGMTGAETAARRGYDVVSCPDDVAYLDYRQSDLTDEPIPFAVANTLADAYAFNPVPPGLAESDQQRILGGQANLWTENIDDPRMIDYYLFPRLCAIADVLWTYHDHDFDSFTRRLAGHFSRLDAIGVEYRRDSGPMPWQTRPGVPGQPADRYSWALHIDALVAGIVDDAAAASGS